MNDRSRSAPLRRNAAGLGKFAAALGGLSAALGIASLPARALAASADSLPIELAWNAPPGCPPSDDIGRDVRRLLAGTELPEALSPIAASVSVRERPGGSFDVRMRTVSGGEDRERELRTESCEEARDLVAFLLALLIDPRARQPEEHSPDTLPPPAPALIRPPPERAAPPSRDGEQAPRWVASLLGTAELGVLPEGSAGGELRMGLLLPGWSVEARGAAWLPRRAEAGSVPGAGGRLELFEAGLSGCLRSASGSSPVLEACVGPSLLSLQGEGYGVREPDRDGAVFAAVSAEAALLVAISPRLGLRSAFGVLVPLRRPTFAIHGIGAIHRPSALALRGSLGFEVGF